MSGTRATVFVSYSHRDREWLERLDIHLRPLQLGGELELWDDRRISPGADWRTTLELALARTRVALLLVSADFLASDFITKVELPALLQAAALEGLVVMPLIIGPSRLASTPGLAHLQTLNDPARPLISLDRAEQEALLVGVCDAVQSALAMTGAAQPSNAGMGPDAEAHAVAHLPLADCLAQLGCPATLLPQAVSDAVNWLARRSADQRWQGQLPGPGELLRDAGGPSEVAARVAELCDQVLSWCAPRHLRSASFYLGTKKISDAHRAWFGGASEASVGVAEKLIALHAGLLRRGHLGFLPARLLLGNGLPLRDDEVVFFRARLWLELPRTELARLPGALEALEKLPSHELYGLMSALFQNPDPFAYPMVAWRGDVGGHPVRMLMSRAHLRIRSVTAIGLVDALRGTPLLLDGLGTFARRAGEVHVQPWCCSLQG